MPSEPRYDIVLFGATSFVGQILTSRLQERLGSDGPTSWAIAGRSQSKLDEVARASGATVDTIVADAGDPGDMAALAASGKVIVSTVGPYARYGSNLVAAVAEAGTDYCDLTGEAHWVRAMVDAHHERAVETGARIVHCCGFDSIPSDLGVWFTQQQARERFGTWCDEIRMRVVLAKGGASGGTVASMTDIAAEVRSDPDLRRMLADPYALVPDGTATATQRASMAPGKDDHSGEWLAPFVMASINTKVVHRSHATLGYPWGKDFRYDETMSMGTGVAGAAKAAGLTAGLGVGGVLLALGPTRRLLQRFVLPEPGEGPSEQAQRDGGFVLRFTGTTTDGRTIETEVTGDQDPGYGSTAKMLREVALAFDASEVGGGVWTPAKAFGDDLVERLSTGAGMTFAVR